MDVCPPPPDRSGCSQRKLDTYVCPHKRINLSLVGFKPGVLSTFPSWPYHSITLVWLATMFRNQSLCMVYYSTSFFLSNDLIETLKCKICKNFSQIGRKLLHWSLLESFTILPKKSEMYIFLCVKSRGFIYRCLKFIGFHYLFEVKPVC